MFREHWATAAAMGLLAVAVHLEANAESGAVAKMPSSGTADQFHLFSIGEVPLDGGYDEKLGLRKVTTGKNKDSPFSDRALRRMWGLSGSKPVEVDGVSWAGEPLRIRITGTRANEFGPLFNIDLGENKRNTAPKGPPIFWTGRLDVKVLPPVEIRLSALDNQIVELECMARGLEMKHHLDNDVPSGFASVWYLDPLDKEQRRDIAEPTTKGNIAIKVVAPSSDSNAVLVGCWYQSASMRDQSLYRGPVFAYDRLYHAVRWRRALDLDEHFTFLSIKNGVYMLEYKYCNACETFGYRISAFAFKTRNNGPSGKPEGPEFYLLHDSDGVSIERSVSWFPGKESSTERR
jgi:hypothetical protein